MKTQSAKSKGRFLQKWVRDLLISIGSRITDQDVRSCSMGAGGEDILMSPKARRQFPVSIECKNLAKFVGYTYLDQAVANAKLYQPVAVVKANRRDPVVVVDAEYFFNLVKNQTKETK